MEPIGYYQVEAGTWDLTGEIICVRCAGYPKNSGKDPVYSITETDRLLHCCKCHRILIHNLTSDGMEWLVEYLKLNPIGKHAKRIRENQERAAYAFGLELE